MMSPSWAEGEPPPAQPAQQAPAMKPVSLAEAMNFAQAYSMRLRIAQARGEAAEAGVDAARAAYYPKVQALAKSTDAIDDRYPGYMRTLDEWGQAQMSLQYTLLDFGRRASELKRAKSDKRGSDLAQAQELSDVQFATVRAYVDSERFGKMQVVANEHVKELERFASLMDERVKGGLSPQSELIRSRLALTNARNRQKGIAKNLEQARQALRSLTGQPVQSASLDAPIDRPKLDAGTSNIDIEGNFALQSLKAQVDSAQAALERIGADRRPRVDLVGSYKKPFQSDVRGLGANVSVQATFDIFDGGLKRARFDEASAAGREADARYEMTRRDLRDAADRLVVDASTAFDQWLLSEAGQQEAERTRALYLDEFRLGTRSLNDLISAQNDYFTQQVDNTDAYSNCLLSVVGLYHVRGDIDAGIQLLGLGSRPLASTPVTSLDMKR